MIERIEQLKAICNGMMQTFYVQHRDLKYDIEWMSDKEKFWVRDYYYGCELELTPEELERHGRIPIGRAMKERWFFFREILMVRRLFVIYGHDETILHGMPMFWCHGNRWVPMMEATAFTDSQMLRYKLPVGGVWQRLPTLRHRKLRDTKSATVEHVSLSS